jgi:hypothetical protein
MADANEETGYCCRAASAGLEMASLGWKGKDWKRPWRAETVAVDAAFARLERERQRQRNDSLQRKREREYKVQIRQIRADPGSPEQKQR